MLTRACSLIVLVTLACLQNNSASAMRVIPPDHSHLSETVTGSQPVQRQGFVTVDGPNLNSRIDAAIKLGRAASSRFWTAYSFDVRPGVSVDFDWGGKRSSGDGFNISFDSEPETRNLGVFLLRESNDGAISRLEVYNLERDREYSGYRVYWLGRAGNEESLNLLRGLVEGQQAMRVSEHATMAIGRPDDPRRL